MMNNNKILTVSYGTFSCTLEGFDDSFGTMKAIAEYFRDLASDDRYFGAEPPVPDAEMLARIAQKEISRRVEAREHDGKIVLSAMEDNRQEDNDQVADEPALIERAAAPVAAVALAEVAAAADQTLSEAQVAEAAVEVPDIAEGMEIIQPEGTEDEAIEQKHTASLDTAPEVTAPEMDTVEDGEVSALDAAVMEDEDENDIEPGQPDADVEAFFDAAPQAVDVEDDVTEAPVVISPDTHPEPNSIAAKLQRIRAVVAQHDVDADDEGYTEDEHANGTADQSNAPVDLMSAISAEELEQAFEDESSDDVMAEARRDIEDALDADEEYESQTTSDAEFASDDDVDDIAAMLNRMAMDDEEDAPTQQSAPVDDESEANDSLVAELDDADDEVVDNLFETDDDIRETLRSAALRDEADAQQDNADAEDILISDDAEDAAPRARVIKVKRADLDAAIARGELEEYDDEDEDGAAMSLDNLAPARSTSTSLSPEDEEELARELAALEADIELEHLPAEAALTSDEGVAQDEDQSEEFFAQNDADADESELEAEEEDQDDMHVAPDSRAKLPSIDDPKGDNMERLMAETDHQMGEPESATRRDAFAHLRAAVAAKKADQAMGSDDRDSVGDDAYRNDLADVVRPRRPTGGGQTRIARPGEGRPAPLKLVAEQRIDVDRPAAAAASGPIRPRRVAAIVETSQADLDGEDSFSEFAAEMGATKLPDLLEAAAAYMSFVEGHKEFSRPQLMTKVRQADSDGFSREDTLRSFGKLLRDGKIEKMKGGRFTASEEIGFRRDERAAG